MMFALFMMFCKSEILENEYEIFPIRNGVGDAEVPIEDDPPATSRFAYVSYFSQEDQWGHYFMNLIVLGYSLKCLSPQYDRVLLIPSGMQISPENLQKINKVWTHVIRRAYVKFTCQELENIRPEEKHFYFKLRLFTLVQYKRVIFIGPNILLAKDPSKLFKIRGAAVPPDYHKWRYTRYGVFHNHDFGAYVPSLNAFSNMTEKCKEAKNDDMSVGFYDRQIIENYQYFSIITLPDWWMFDVTDPEYLADGAPSDFRDPRIIAYRYSLDSRPWSTSIRLKKSFMSQAYVQCLKKAMEYVGDDVGILRRYMMVDEDLDRSDFVVKQWPEPSESVEYDRCDVSLEHEGPRVRQRKLRYATIALATAGIIGFAIARHIEM